MAKVGMSYEVWHLNDKLIKAIEDTNCEEGEKLIIKTRLKQGLVNVINFLIGFAGLFFFFGFGGLIIGIMGGYSEHNAGSSWGFVGWMLLISIPTMVLGYIAVAKIKQNVINDISRFVQKKKIDLSKINK